jgi:hypothetical protein
MGALSARKVLGFQRFGLLTAFVLRGQSMKKMGTSIAAAAALAASVVMTSAAGAAPAAATQGLAKQADSNIELVRDRGGRHHGHRGHRHHRGHWGGGWGWGAAALGAGLLLGAPYVAGAYDDGDYDDDGYASYSYRGRYASDGGVARCEATFRSFDPASGTYMGYDGVRRMCPYL